MDPRLDLRKIHCLILAVLNLSVLICLAKGDNGTTYLSYYPANHTLLRGEYVSGRLPSSIRNVDSEYLIFQSIASDTSFPINPSWYTLGGSTSLISGNLTDLTSSNDVHMTFRSYYSGINTVDFVDGALSDVDFSADKGTHSIFSTQQAGPDGIHDTIEEENTKGIVFERVTVSSEQSTTNTVWTDIPESTVTFTPGSSAEEWMIFVTADIRSDSTSEIQAMFRYSVNGVSMGEAGVQQGTTNTFPINPYNVYFHFSRITGESSQQTVKFQYRASLGTTAYARNIHILCIRLNSAGLEYAEVNGNVSIRGFQTLATLQFTPPESGDYIMAYCALVSELPTGGGAETWLDFDSGTSLHPETWSTPNTRRVHTDRDHFEPHGLFQKMNLSEAEHIFNVQAQLRNAGDTSTARDVRIAGFRTDAFDLLEFDEDTFVNSTSGTNTVRSVVNTQDPGEQRDYLILAGIHTISSSISSREAGGIEVNDVFIQRKGDQHLSMTEIARIASHHASVKTSSTSFKVETTYGTGGTGTDTIYSKQSVIYILKIPENYELDLELQWTGADYTESNEDLCIHSHKGGNSHSLDAEGGYMIIGNGMPDWGSTTGTISFWIKMDISVQGRFWGQNDDMEIRWSGTNLVLDWGETNSMTSAYSFSADTWYFISIVWNEINDDLLLYIGDKDNPPTIDANSLNRIWTASTPAPTENRFLNGLGSDEPVNGHGDDLRYWNVSRNLTEIQNDYKTELTGSEPGLRSYFKLNNNFDDIGPDNDDSLGSGFYLFSSEVSFEQPPTEDIHVDVWHNGSYHNLLTNLEEGWNNVSISSYLESPTITIRFKGSEEIEDTIQDSWKIDVTLLHIWSDEQAIEVEFKGSSNSQNRSNLNWTANIGWTIGSVNVIIQIYNFSLGDYSPDGNGYLSYNSSVTAQEDETKSQTIYDNSRHFKNSTGHWKMKLKGVKSTETQFNMKVDLLQIKLSDVYTLSTEFTFSGMTTNTATLLNFSLVSRCSESATNITLQVWNYSCSAYTTDLETCLRYASNGQNETKTLSIIANPQFYVSNGTGKIRISGESLRQFQQEIDQIILRYGYSMKTSWGQLFSWPRILMFTLPLIAGLLFIPIFLSKRKKKTKNLFEDKVYPFSKSFGMSHQKMSGKKILLEVDPTSDFQEALFSFVSEARIHDEKLLIFTSKSSPLHSKFSGVKNIKFYLLASKASSHLQGNAKETLLPANDLSVLLNTLAKIHGIKRRKPVKVLFDNLSDNILLCGFEKTYKFIRWLLETITSPKMTILFVFNPTAHDPKTSSSIRGLFSTQLAYGKNGAEIITL